MRRAVVVAVAATLASCAPARPGPDRVFVSDEQANVVHVLDGATGKVEAVLHTGARPRGLALSPDGRTLFVAASNADRIEAWDTARLTHVRDLAAGSDPERIALSPDGRTLYAANEDHSTAAFIDVGTGKVMREVAVGPEPEGVAASPDGRFVVVTSEVASTAHVIEAATGKVLANLPVGSRPRDVLFLSDRGEAWVSSEQRGTVTVFALPQWQERATIDLVAALPDVDKVQAVEMKRTADGRRVFVALGRGNAVAEIDPANRRLVRTFPVGERCWGIALSPGSERLYAAAGLSRDLTVIDLRRNDVARTVHLGGKPWTVLAVSQ